jgi:hypothetical protein
MTHTQTGKIDAQSATSLVHLLENAMTRFAGHDAPNVLANAFPMPCLTPDRAISPPICNRRLNWKKARAWR